MTLARGIAGFPRVDARRLQGERACVRNGGRQTVLGRVKTLPLGGSYRYRAFISYRHEGEDGRVAHWLHQALENQIIPKGIAGQDKPFLIGRLFRDEAELPTSSSLSQVIMDALQQSENLIVICSPRLLESKWCRSEIERFQALGRHDRIHAVLISGEPKDEGGLLDPFPPELRRYVNPAGVRDGTGGAEMAAFEPIAADLRKQNREAVKLKVLAGLLRCNFDDLYQRARRLNRFMMRTAAAAGAAVLCVILLLGIHARHTSYAAEQTQRLNLAQNLSTAAEELAKEGNTELAMLLALQAYQFNEQVDLDAIQKNDAMTAVDKGLRAAWGRPDTICAFAHC